MPYLICLGAAALLFLILSLCLFFLGFFSPYPKQNDDLRISNDGQTASYRDTIIEMIASLRQVPCERVTIQSRDGLTLSARHYHRRNGAPLAICFHGYRGTPLRDFSGGASFYLNAGFNLLMPDERAHGESGGHVLTLGIKERFDCADWAAWARETYGPGTEILLCGISMGAATVLMASELPLPETVRGIIADAPFTSPKAILRAVSQEVGIPPAVSWPFVWTAARLFARFSPTAADAAEAVKHSPVPVLVIHGEDDHFVPCDMGREIAAAAPDKVTLATFPGAGHGLSFLTDRERYEAEAKAFFDKVLSK